MLVALKFLGPDLDPALITQVLGLPPSQSGRKGDPIVAVLPGGRSLSRPSTSGYWCIDITPDPDADAALVGVLDRLSCDSAVLKRLAASWQGQVVIHEAGPGASRHSVLSADTLSRLSDLGISIYVNDD